MQLFIKICLSAVVLLGAQKSSANPYFDETKVPKDPPFKKANPDNVGRRIEADGKAVTRFEIGWNEKDESYFLDQVISENSGTEALYQNALTADSLGSYHGVLRDPKTKSPVAFDSIGTGKEYRKLVRALTFRFPQFNKPLNLEVYAENPKSGVTELVLEKRIEPTLVAKADRIIDPAFEVRLIRPATQTPSLRLNIYAEGYLATEKNTFWTAAQKVADVLAYYQFPGLEKFEIRGVFLSSSQTLGPAQDLGMPIPEGQTALGLYFPYWDNFGRWDDVVYPTRENKFRQALGMVGYDYPLVLINNNDYWGVGNYKAMTAIPAQSQYFAYLLLHEFGHFFGLNEEYEGGGRTELEFAPQIQEPWSQNITFLNSHDHQDLKWKNFVSATTPLPTGNSTWVSSKPVYGAYRGGYADSDTSHSHKPGFQCTMEIGYKFCPICTHAIKEVIARDLNEKLAVSQTF